MSATELEVNAAAEKANSKKLEENSIEFRTEFYESIEPAPIKQELTPEQRHEGMLNLFDMWSKRAQPERAQTLHTKKEELRIQLEEWHKAEEPYKAAAKEADIAAIERAHRQITVLKEVLQRCEKRLDFLDCCSDAVSQTDTVKRMAMKVPDNPLNRRIPMKGYIPMEECYIMKCFGRMPTASALHGDIKAGNEGAIKKFQGIILGELNNAKEDYDEIKSYVFACVGLIKSFAKAYKPEYLLHCVHLKITTRLCNLAEYLDGDIITDPDFEYYHLKEMLSALGSLSDNYHKYLKFLGGHTNGVPVVTRYAKLLNMAEPCLENLNKFNVILNSNPNLRLKASESEIENLDSNKKAVQQDIKRVSWIIRGCKSGLIEWGVTRGEQSTNINSSELTICTMKDELMKTNDSSDTYRELVRLEMVWMLWFYDISAINVRLSSAEPNCREIIDNIKARGSSDKDSLEPVLVTASAAASLAITTTDDETTLSQQQPDREDASREDEIKNAHETKRFKRQQVKNWLRLLDVESRRTIRQQRMVIQAVRELMRTEENLNIPGSEGSDNEGALVLNENKVAEAMQLLAVYQKLKHHLDVLKAIFEKKASLPGFTTLVNRLRGRVEFVKSGSNHFSFTLPNTYAMWPKKLNASKDESDQLDCYALDDCMVKDGSWTKHGHGQAHNDRVFTDLGAKKCARGFRSAGITLERLQWAQELAAKAEAEVGRKPRFGAR